MTSRSISLRLNSVEEIRRLPGSWQPSDCRRVLEVLDIDDFESDSDDDLESMALMALQDHDPDEAMRTILSNFTGDRFTRGQIQNLCSALKEDRAWEEYPVLTLQETLYICVDLLSAAFPLDYPAPSATRVRLTLQGADLDKMLARRPLDSAIVLRGVGLCLAQDSVLNRFFSGQAGGGPAFSEAAGVIWGMETASAGSNTLEVTFWGSSYWLEKLEEGVEVSCSLKSPQD